MSAPAELDTGGDPPAEGDGSHSVTFYHASEREFARILDFYQIPWQYEPRTFELEWDDQGNVAEAFAPDFYLSEQDLYIELTTMQQRLITKKHRKLRRLHELYPDVNIKLLNRHGVQQMMLKYGLDAGDMPAGSNALTQHNPGS